LADFRIAEYCKKGKILDGFVGIPQYISPEVFDKRGSAILQIFGM
jgi:hypothetical protein